MAVPNTSNFSLNDVRIEVDPSKNNLDDLFLIANTINSKGFVNSYAGAKDRLSNFRGYSRVKTYY